LMKSTPWVDSVALVESEAMMNVKTL